MTDKAKNTVPSQPELKYVKSPEYRSTYSNNVAYIISPLDFSLIFGQILEGDQERLVIEQITKVTMAPIQAKLLAHLLNDQVEVYEKNNGEIIIPGGISLSPRAIPSVD
jgi:hypothetical protein